MTSAEKTIKTKNKPNEPLVKVNLQRPNLALNSQLPAWFTTELLAAQTGLSKQYWKVRRSPEHPEFMELAFIRIGRSVRYKRADVETWMANREQASASEAQ